MILRVCWRTKQKFHFALKIGSEFQLVWCLMLSLTNVISMQFSAQFLFNIRFQTKLFLKWRHCSCASWQPSWVIIPVGDVACNYVCWCNWWFPCWWCITCLTTLPFTSPSKFSSSLFSVRLLRLGLGCVPTHWHQQEHQGLGCVTQHTSKNTKARAVSQHIDTSKNTKAWAVS